MSTTKKETMKVETPVEKNVSLELGMGWLPEYPDLNDYGVEKNEDGTWGVDPNRNYAYMWGLANMIEKIGITEVDN